MTFLERRQRVTDPAGTLLFLEIEWPASGDTLRLVNDNQDWESNGEVYVGHPFRLTPPDDVAGQSPRGVLEIDNVGRGVTADLEAWQPGHVLYARVMLADRADPDTYMIDMPLPLMRVSVNSTTARAEGGMDMLLRQQAVQLRYTPYKAPGLF
jgi:hypothetical protein